VLTPVASICRAHACGFDLPCRQSLPLYLSVTPDQIMSQFRSLDEDVLSEVVMKIGFDRAELLESLQKQERNQMTVAYYLILDHKRRKMLGACPDHTPSHAVHVAASRASHVGARGSRTLSTLCTLSTLPTRCPRCLRCRRCLVSAYAAYAAHERPWGVVGAGASPVMHATQLVDVSTGEAMAVGPDSAPEAQQTPQQAAMAAQALALAPAAGGHAAAAQQMGCGRSAMTAPMMSSAVQRSAADGTQRRWHLGVQSSLAPADMMLEIFRVLRTLRFEWKIVAQYSLKCRPCTRPPTDGGPAGAGTLDASSMAVRCKVKVGLQLYKIAEDSYLLDIRKVDGDVLPFMDVCSLLLGELKL
jgi:hypothetical protein